MFQQMFANYFRIAESAIQFQNELLRQWGGQWPTAPVADRRTEQILAMQLKLSEERSEMLDLQRKLLAMVNQSENRLLEEGPQLTQATALPRPDGGMEAQTAVPAGASTAPNGLPPMPEVAATTFREGEDATIVLRDEELQAHESFVETGEVRVHKEVITEHRTIEVPVQREELVIERHPPNGDRASATEIGPGEEIRIALPEEPVSLKKRPVVKKKATAGKRVVQKTERIGGDGPKGKAARRAPRAKAGR
jgi:uncharacterized protein (TIGR02271 family)